MNLEELRQRELVNAIKTFVRNVPHNAIERAFEREGCTCLPLRTELDRLRAEKKAKEIALETEYEPRIAELHARVDAVDAAEHPDLDREAGRASSFFPVYLVERVQRDGPDVLTDTELVTDFVHAWKGGWRPRA